MGILVKDQETDRAVRKLAKLRGTTLTEAIRNAVLKELAVAEPDNEDAQFASLLRKAASYPDTGLKADKDFYDSLYED